MKNYTLTRKSELKTATWAGGTTTQLFISPPEAEYTKFNFDFRISYATVEVPESTFTFMPGVTRHLMIMKGSLHINHTDRYQKQLNKFDSDVFNGEWPTKAKGQVTDFNLMTRGGAVGEVTSLLLSQNTSHSLPLTNSHTHTGIYLFNGSLTLQLKSETIQLNEGDFILLPHSDYSTIELKTNTNCELIISRVKKQIHH